MEKFDRILYALAVILLLISNIVSYKYGYYNGKKDVIDNYKKEIAVPVKTDTIIILKYKMIQDVENARNLNDSDVVKLFNELVTQ